MNYKSMKTIRNKEHLTRVRAACAEISDILLKLSLQINMDTAVEVEDDCVRFIINHTDCKQYVIKVSKGYCPIKLFVVDTQDSTFKEVKNICRETPVNGPCESSTLPATI